MLKVDTIIFKNHTLIISTPFYTLSRGEFFNALQIYSDAF
ncbi:hypothetical protein ABIC74_003227 [Mucilaginibacter rubeus]|jgi:hypothetical protein